MDSFVSLGVGASETIAVTCTSTDLTTSPSPLSNSVQVTAKSAASLATADLTDSSSATCSGLAFDSGLTPNKSCASTGTKPAVRIIVNEVDEVSDPLFITDIQVDVNFTLQNSSDNDLNLRNVAVRDDLLISATPASDSVSQRFTCTTDVDTVGVTCVIGDGKILAVNETASFTGTYSALDAPLMGSNIDNADESLGKIPSTVTFENAISASATTVLTGVTVGPVSAMVSCPLCDSNLNDTADGGEDLCPSDS